MAFICIICNCNLSQNKSNGNSDAILATFCGHLYHQSCLYRNIAVRRRSLHEQEHHARVTASMCPTCNRVIDKQKLMQIFPNEADDDEGHEQIERLTKERDEIKWEITRLQGELKDFKDNSKRKWIRDSGRNTRLTNEILPYRRQIVELKSTRKGFKIGSRVMWLKNEPEEGMVRWLGTIDGIVNAGIEFVNPIGNAEYLKINGEQLFACENNHGRIVAVQDIMLYSEFQGNGNTDLYSMHWQIDDNDERQKIERIREHYQQLVMNVEMQFESFIPTIETMLANKIAGDTVLINVQIQTAKDFETDLAENKTLINSVKEVAKLLLESLCVPLYEKCEIDQKLEELNETFANLETTVVFHIKHNLTQAFYHAQKCEDLISYRVKLLQDFKSKLRNMGQTLIVNECQLSDQISELSELQDSFLVQKQGEVSVSDIFGAIHEFRKYGSDSSKFETATKDIISAHNQLLEDISTKSSILRKAQLLYRQFITYTSQFEEWYDCYMAKLAKVPPQSTDDKLPKLMQEKEEKRKELVQILNSAKELRVSIFDSTVLDDKIESLQKKWKILLDKASEHRSRARKTF